MMAFSSKVVLYSNWRSSCSFRVRTVLNLKRIQYEIVSIDVFDQARLNAPEFRKVNPMGQVPALEIDGTVMTQSHAIVNYLDETRPEPCLLLPTDFKLRAKVREICEILHAGIQPLQNVGVLRYLDDDDKNGGVRLRWAQRWIGKGFAALEQILSKCSGRYSVGDAITMADCFLVPQVFNARNWYKVDLKLYPHIERIDKELEDHPAFRHANPFNQPDCPRPDAKL